MSTTPPSSSSRSSLHLLHLPRSVLRRILLHLDVDEVRQLKETNSGRAFKQQANESLTSFLSSLITVLEDRSQLAREAALRTARFQQLGYKAGLDEMDARVEKDSSIMQQPFTEGFQAGAREGFTSAQAQGLIAAIACFMNKHTNLFPSELREQTAIINNQINSNIVKITSTTTPSTSTSSSSTTKSAARIAISTEADCSSSSAAGCGSDNCCKTNPTSASTSSAELPPPLLPPVNLTPLDALAHLRPLIQQIRLDPTAVENLLELPTVPSFSVLSSTASPHGDPSAAMPSRLANTSRPTAIATAPQPASSVEASQMAALDW